ncbi:kelch-like protein 9 [Folsomia candida]|uniref:Kelch-like protein diablo n=1 Tax=Folsomia candida TaxID=158441 RepID=A0A226F3T3_FOLCA|nr:kelch-like protein 9 [Folsomia candida]XP_035702093.1 kelch-like protein 9 [Folsomia candida]OXA64020.1 Kelch-like protein 13 [Folsomia candida]
MDPFGVGDMFEEDSNNKLNHDQTVQFESPTHTGILLSGLNNLRSRNLLVDVTLIADGQSFEAHRVVLASISDYFRSMFTSDVRESNLKEITLEGVSARGIQYLLDYAYTSRLSLNLLNIQDVLSTASHVQVTTVVEACSSYLQEQLDLENCVDIVTLAETYSLHQLRKRVYRFICGHLMDFSQTQDFQRLSVAQLEYLLQCDYCVDCTEAEVLQIVLQWVEFDTCRIQHSTRLLSKINFEEIPPKCLGQMWDYTILHCVCSQSNSDSIYKLIVSQVLIDQAAFIQRKKPTASLVNSRGMELAIIKVGGFGISGVTNEITYYLPSIGHWKRLTTIPHVEQSNFGMTVLNNELYVVGGCFNQCLQENIHPFGFSYNPRFSKWSTMAPMLTERCRFTLNVVQDKIYAVGGASENVDDIAGTTEACACESYNPATDSWSQIAPLTTGRTQHAGAAWNNLLFISGGLDHDVVSNALLCFNTLTNEWTIKLALLTARADHAMVTYKDKLYVCGGWCEDEANGNRFLVGTIDEYDIRNDRWTVVTEIPTPRYHAGITLIQNKLQIIGGFHSDATFDRTTGVIECFDLDTAEWSTMSPYPQDLWEHCCASLYIPRSRDDMDVIQDIQR